MFVIYALPRSRTYWLSRFLSYGDWTCAHDEIVHCRSMDDVKSWLGMPNTGSVETAAAPFWRLAKDVPTVVIRRPVDDVVDSLHKIGLRVDRRIIQRLDAKLDQIEQRIPNVMSIQFDDLRHEHTCQAIFEFCLPYRHDPDWWQSLDAMNLQVDIRHVARYFKAHEAQLMKLSTMAKHVMLADLNKSCLRHDFNDGLVLQEETYAAWVSDGARLIEDHLLLVGEEPDVDKKDLSMLGKLHASGNLQIITARSNGRMFGYLVSVIAPSFETAGETTSISTTFYASPDWPGLGMKLQRYSINALRDKGVDQAFFYAGVRGSGQRLSAMYRRLGAADNGSFYKMSLQA